ncbi:tldc domain-containing protein [Stylonychia lemnae]|uniref:Tldc domain-containing protein n=1 Tax=Stylonychia lemnae TaxID=5949 RepID=A0A078AN75_STYLE|nr:tldc domain-containing protein [Stylonychia lemnae]|eukprot:CDW83614.1 tldc domain-containing protein [Stylonychia lemnae]
MLIIKPELEIPVCCDFHLDQEASFYCYQDEIMMCLQCKQDHEQFKIHSSNQHLHINKTELENYAQRLDFKLVELLAHVTRIKAILGDHISSKVRISSSEFMGNIKLIQEVLSPLHQDEIKKNQIIFLSKTQEIVETYLKTFDSEIIPKQYNVEAKDLLEQWLGFKANFELLYRGSRDGFRSDTFHEYCDYQGPTLTLVKSEFNKIFGGYASLSWSSKEKWQQDNQAFLFSMTHQTKHPLVKNKQQAMLCNSRGYMIVFGGGDLQIFDECDKQKVNNFSTLGMCYELPKGVQFMDKEASSYLAGDRYFEVIDIEVYRVSRK